MTKTIVFDIDGVLANFITPAVKLGYELDGEIPPDNWTQTSWDDYGGLNAQQIERLWRYIEKNPSFWAKLSPLVSYEECAKIFNLFTHGHRVYFATNRRLPGAYENTVSWLEMFIGTGCGLVITKRKGEFCRVVEADYYIDDKSENVDCAIWLTDGKTKAFVRDSLTNRGPFAPHSSKAGRVYSVTEFLKEVQRDI